MRTNLRIGSRITLGAVCAAVLVAGGGSTASVSAEGNGLTVDALDAVLDLDSDGAFCASYRSAVRFVGGDEVAEIVVDLAVDYADELGHDITVFATDVIVAYVERECVAATATDGPSTVDEPTAPEPITTIADEDVVASAGDGAVLADLTEQPDITGWVGPIVLSDGTQVAVIARTGDAMAMTGTVELAVDHDGSWVVDQTLDVGFPDSPHMVGDLTGDGVTELVVTMLGGTGAKSWDVIYQINSDGPTLEEIPYAVNELEPLLGTLPFGLTVYTVQPDSVATSVVTCEPSCAEDPGTSVDWYLDRSGSLILRPQPSGSTAEADTSEDCLTTHDAADLLVDEFGNDPFAIDPASITSLRVDCGAGWAMAGISPNSTFVDGMDILLQQADSGMGPQWTVVDYGTGDICDYHAPQTFCDYLYNGDDQPDPAPLTPADEPGVPDTIVVMVEVFNSQGCDSDYAMGFDHAEIEIRDGSRDLITVGRLESYEAWRTGELYCRFFTDLVDVMPLHESPDGFYEVTVGTLVDDTIVLTADDLTPIPVDASGSNPLGFWITFNDMDGDGIPDDEPWAEQTDPAYNHAYDAWLEVPSGEDLCDEYNDGTLNDSLINYVYPNVDHDSMWAVLADHC